jgi:hypothetical protein
MKPLQAEMASSLLAATAMFSEDLAIGLQVSFAEQ